MTDDDLLLVGRVARAHGNRGQVIVDPDSDFAEERFKPGAVLFVGRGAHPRRVREVRFHRGRPIIALEGVETMNDAEALAGSDLKVDASALQPLPAGTFYHHDLIGCEVVDAENVAVGTVRAVEGPMERSNLVVESGSGEVLIPLVADICIRVDTGARRIIVRPPEGLLDLNRRKKERG